MTKQTKITNAQAEALAYAVRQYAQAQAADFETWCRTCYYCNGYAPKFDSTFDEWISDRYMRTAKLDHKNDVDGYIARQIERLRNEYNEHRAGIVITTTSSNTLRALEKKGLIEIIEDGRRNFDTIRLLYI